VFCVDLRKAIISLYNINWLVCITETESVYCAVRTGSLHVIQDNFRPKGCALPHAGSRRRPPKTEARFPSQISLYEICGEQRGTRTGFSLGTSSFPCQYHSTNAPLSTVSIIPQMFHSPLSVSFHQCSTLPCQYHSTNAPLSPVSTIPPMLHSPLSVPFYLCSTLPCQYHSIYAPLSPVSTIPPMLHSPLSVPFHQSSTLPCQYHSTNAPHSSSFIYLLLSIEKETAEDLDTSKRLFLVLKGRDGTVISLCLWKVNFRTERRPVVATHHTDTHSSSTLPSQMYDMHADGQLSGFTSSKRMWSVSTFRNYLTVSAGVRNIIQLDVQVIGRMETRRRQVEGLPSSETSEETECTTSAIEHS